MFYAGVALLFMMDPGAMVFFLVLICARFSSFPRAAIP